VAREDLRKILFRNINPEITAGRQRQALLSTGDGERSPAQRSQLARMLFPPYLYKLPSSSDFNQNNYATVLAAAISTQVVPVSFQLPQQSVGYLQQFGLYCLSPTNLTNVTFTIRINEGPVPGWDNVLLPVGVTNLTLQNFADLQIRLPNNCKVDVLVTNNAATGPWTVGAKIAGWYHTSQAEERMYGEV